MPPIQDRDKIQDFKTALFTRESRPVYLTDEKAQNYPQQE